MPEAGLIHNPFPHTDADRHAIWEMLMARDIRAFVRGEWAAVAEDFDHEQFNAVNAHHSHDPRQWRLSFPTVDSYRDVWLEQAAQSRAVAYAEPLEAGLHRVSSLHQFDVQGSAATVLKRFDGVLLTRDGAPQTLAWQSLYFCRRVRDDWKIRGFVGYLPLN